MSKTKSAFVCQNCGAQSPKWIGKCTECGEWNSYIEEIISVSPAHKTTSFLKLSQAEAIDTINIDSVSRMDTSNSELNRVLGGGLVPGSVILIGGEPGIGKSTLVLQVALKIKNCKVLYISGEESPQQIKLRSLRLQSSNKECFICAETNLDSVLAQIQNTHPGLVIIDSIQTLSSERLEAIAGSVSQVRESTNQLIKIAKETGIPVLIVGHINKEGNLAGPKVLEHMVDTVLQFEGDRNHIFRILRASKNRFGSISEIGIYQMQGDGLREVLNPSELLFSTTDLHLSGIAIAAPVEGIRPLMVEVQSLVSTAAYGMPQRSATGFDSKRLNMLLAILEKRAGFKLSSKDVFLNIAGGIRIDDPAMDLAVIVSILSSDLDFVIEHSYCFAAELGLSGQIRPVTRIEQRVMEAQKLGFSQIFISKYNQKGVDFSQFSIKVVFISKVEELIKILFR